MTKRPLAQARLLIVDDEVAQLRALCDTLQMEGYQVSGHDRLQAALDVLRPGDYDLLLTDLTMPQMDGITLLNEARRIDPELAGVVMTGHGTIDTAVKAMQIGALDYIQKPFKLNVVLSVIERALEVRNLRLENTALLLRERQYTAQLETANRDLEAFSLTVSHDLRAPLRTVIGFCELLAADYEGALPDEGRRLLTHIVNSTTRMDALIEGLLRFSRFSRQPLLKSIVDCNAIVQACVADLRRKHVDRDIQWHIALLPDCEGDRMLLEQVFFNLLANAIKFTVRRERAIIEVGTCERDAEQVIFIRDNGAGFDMQYADKLFGVFQRMHSQQEFEGTGVGLSIVQRIIQRHGGRIWAESIPDIGTTFFFTLPIVVAEAIS